MNTNNIVYLAREFAILHHGDQKYGEHPYVYHLDQVAALLDNDTEKALAYLHDIREDTKVTYEEIVAKFGYFIADCVEFLTDCQGANRKERKKLTNEKLSKLEGKYKIVLRVKIADRLANMTESLLSDNISKLEMYNKEMEEFFKAVSRISLNGTVKTLENADLWAKVTTINDATSASLKR
jgi:(p)ppGpp synthase/HD superfamily hydrolase